MIWATIFGATGEKPSPTTNGWSESADADKLAALPPERNERLRCRQFEWRGNASKITTSCGRRRCSWGLRYKRDARTSSFRKSRIPASSARRRRLVSLKRICCRWRCRREHRRRSRSGSHSHGWLRGRRSSRDHTKQHRFKDVVCRTRSRHLSKGTIKKREKQKKPLCKHKPRQDRTYFIPKAWPQGKRL